jgi:hypothetical protein
MEYPLLLGLRFRGCSMSASLCTPLPNGSPQRYRRDVHQKGDARTVDGVEQTEGQGQSASRGH